MSNVCVLCGEVKNGQGMYYKHKFVCVDCEREIAKAYAGTFLDPVNLLMLKHADGNTTIEVKTARR